MLDDFISAELISKFAIVPAEFAVIVFATISPVIFAAEAVICPVDFSLKLLLDDFISVVDNSKPPTVPPVNST